MTDQERAEDLIRAGVPVEAKDFTCPCGETVTVRVPGKPGGVHAPLVLVNDAGEVIRVLDVWVHNSPRCWSKALKALTAGTGAPEATDGGDEEEAPTPIRHRRAKGDTEEAVEIHARPEVASAVAAGLD